MSNLTSVSRRKKDLSASDDFVKGAQPGFPQAEEPVKADAQKTGAKEKEGVKPKRLNIDLHPEKHKNLKALAVAEGTSVKKIVEALIDQKLASQ